MNPEGGAHHHYFHWLYRPTNGRFWVTELIEKPEPCDFGTGEDPKACGWENTPNVTAARSIPWVISRGDDALFKGGPRTDHTENNGAGGSRS